jgi:hypothetical protein
MELWDMHGRGRSRPVAIANGTLPYAVTQRKVLQWADVRMCASAAKGGHLEVLEWAHENGCPWEQNNLFGRRKRG